MRKKRSLGLVIYLLILFLGQRPPNAFSDYPEIENLNLKDVLFKQLQADIQSFYRGSSRRGVNRENPRLRFFSYHNRQELDIFSLAARLNLPYDTLVSLNGLESPSDLKPRLWVPNQPGVFVSLNPENDFEEILHSLRRNNPQESQRIMVGSTQKPFLYFPGDRFHPLERAFFLNILFRFPLPAAKLTSEYGLRADPYTGHPQFHQGIDLAAPEGTEVFAAREGVVEALGFDAVLGNHVIVQHQGGYQTVYGHLSGIEVSLKQRVSSAMIIGRVGSTGLSTGPHLHFEIRRRGHSKDPVPLLPMGRTKS